MPRNNFTTDYVFDEATSDEGMTLKQAIRFHAHNPHGVVASLPDYEFFTVGTTFYSGAQALWGRYDSYYSRAIQKEARRMGVPRTNWGEFRGWVESAQKEAEQAHAFMAQKKEAA